MYIVIVGCGSLGAELATSLSAEGHNIVVVDNDPDAFSQLGLAFNGVTVVGNGTDISALREAGCENADAVAAVTSDDNVNITVAEIASTILKVPKVVARVFEPQREAVFKELGLATVCPTLTGVDVIREVLLSGTVHRRLSLGAGEVIIYEVPVGKDLAGRRVSEVEVPQKLRVVAITRNGLATIVGPETVFEEGDLATLAVRVDALAYFHSLVSGGADTD